MHHYQHVTDSVQQLMNLGSPYLTSSLLSSAASPSFCPVLPSLQPAGVIDSLRKVIVGQKSAHLHPGAFLLGGELLLALHLLNLVLYVILDTVSTHKGCTQRWGLFTGGSAGAVGACGQSREELRLEEGTVIRR